MDLVAACRVFVSVAERGSFTVGAAAVGVPQSVASRRVAALEAHFDAPLFDRSTRRAALSPFGRDLLPSAKRLVQLADALDHNAAQLKLRPVALAVPAACSVRKLAALEAAARACGTIVEFRTGTPPERIEMARAREVRMALVSVPAAEASWVVPLGLASVRHRATRALRLEQLRPRRGDRSFTRIWLQHEDDRPHIGDRLVQAGHRAALLPAQIAIADTVTAGLSDVLSTDNLLLCSAAEAEEWGLPWRRLVDLDLARGYAVEAAAGDDPGLLRDELHADVALLLGATAALTTPEAEPQPRRRRGRAEVVPR
jgi:DNA-binding transcriptional LysR family regulator